MAEHYMDPDGWKCSSDEPQGDPCAPQAAGKAMKPTQAQLAFLVRLKTDGRARICFLPWWGVWNDGTKFRVPTLKACARRGWIRMGAVVDDGFYTEVHLSTKGKKLLETNHNG
jgi:hypothetical protein